MKILRRGSFAVGAVAAAIAAFSAAPALANLAYDWQTGAGDCNAACNANYSYTVADTFTVNSGVTLNALALYDSSQATIGTDIYVALFNDTTNSTVITLDFKGVTDPTKAMYVTLGISGGPITLIAGDVYSIEAWGFTSTNETYVHTQDNDNIVFNSFGGALSDYGSENCNGQTGVFQATNTTLSCYRDMHGMDFFGAGSFNIPEPPGWGLVLGGIGAMSWFAMRRRRRSPSGA
jgi:hypothetical protein